MKKLLIIASLFIFANVGLAQTEKEISAIRSDVKLINKSGAKYTKKTLNVEGISLEGAEVTYFVSGKGLRKIAAKIYGETFKSTIELYYSGEELIFAFEEFSRYNGHFAMTPPPQIAKTEERRFYFSGGNMIRLLVGKKELKSGDEDYSDLNDGMLDIASKLKAAYEDSINDES